MPSGKCRPARGDRCRRDVVLDFARNYVAEVQGGFPLNDTSSDGQYAYQRALRTENLALAQYTRVLRLYTDLVMRGHG